MIQQILDIIDPPRSPDKESEGFSWSMLFKLRLLIVLIGLSAIFQYTPIFSYLVYQRELILDGDYWLLFTGNVVHLGTAHLLMNAAGLTLIVSLVGENYSEREWLFIGLVSSAFVGLGLFVFMPELQRYVGLSGMIHGVLIAGALLEWRRSGMVGVAVAVLSVVKVGYEQYVGPMPGSEDTVGGRVIVDSHFYGAIGGFVAAVLVLAWRFLTTQKNKFEPSIPLKVPAV